LIREQGALAGMKPAVEHRPSILWTLGSSPGTERKKLKNKQQKAPAPSSVRTVSSGIPGK
jgi:hypothetical protein